MLLVISPAKTLDYDTPPVTPRFTLPAHLEQASELIERLRELSPAQISELMDLSDKLAGLNAARYGSWTPDFTPANAKQALLAFKGDVYTGLNAEDFSEADFDFAQRHLRMLSGLYGVLRPLDLMQPYRLEMGTKLSNARGKNLYEFWGERISQWLNEAMADQGDNILLNLASNEYFSAVKRKALNARIIDTEFKDLKNGQYKIISFYAKKARGLMARYVIKERLSNPEDLKAFDLTEEASDIRAAYGKEAFGQGCLLARRLVERGVRFVEVSLGGWDTHNANFVAVPERCETLDKGLSALLNDLNLRGMLQDTLVVVTTEFGRTPDINQNVGRDHYPKAFSAVMFGGGVKGGYVHGKTDKEGREVVEDKVKVPDFNATIAYALGLPLDQVIYSPSKGPFTIADKGQPVTGVFA